MLVLSRKKNQQICIGDSISITVLEIRGDKVRLGFEAPQEIPIDRREIRDLRRLLELCEPEENSECRP